MIGRARETSSPRDRRRSRNRGSRSSSPCERTMLGRPVVTGSESTGTSDCGTREPSHAVSQASPSKLTAPMSSSPSTTLTSYTSAPAASHRERATTRRASSLAFSNASDTAMHVSTRAVRSRTRRSRSSRLAAADPARSALPSRAGARADASSDAPARASRRSSRSARRWRRWPPGLRWQRRPLNEPARRSVFGLTPSRRAASATRSQSPRSAGTVLSVVSPPTTGLVGTISSELDRFCREEVGFCRVRSATGRIAPRRRPP